MIYAILIGSLTVLGFAFNAAKRIMRFKKKKLSESLEELYDPYDRIKFIMIVAVQLIIILLTVVCSLFNASLISTILIEASEMINLLILLSLSDIFGKKYMSILSTFMIIVDAIMFVYVLIERIPYIATFLSAYATSAYIVFISIMIASFVLSAIFSLVIVNLSNAISFHSEDYKQGNYKIKKNAFLRKIMINEDKVKGLFKENEEGVIL